MPAPRVISLLPAATEMVAALDATDLLVGRSHECDFPEAIKSLPVVTRSNIDSSQASQIIHQSVTDRLQAGLSLYELDSEKIFSLEPDLILTQAQCDVCAINFASVEKLLRDWRGQPPKVLTFAATSLIEVERELEQLAGRLDRVPQAQSVLQSWHRRLAILMGRARRPPPTVLAIEWINPLMVAGNWIPSLITRAGGKPLLSTGNGHSHWIQPESAIASDPDVILFLPCGFDLQRTRQEIAPLLNDPAWRTLRAFWSNSAFALDGNSYFNRPGPRLIDSVEIVSDILSSLGTDRDSGRGWARLKLE